MKALHVNEIFYSLQGEGARAGEPSVFVRLKGCDLACGFCDTEFESGKEMSCRDLSEYIKARFKPSDGYPLWIVWTGGEPTLQLTPEIVAFFKSEGFLQAIETNGNHPVPCGLDWVVCSPKVAEHVLEKNIPEGVDELRYVRHKGQMAVPEPKIKAKVYCLSPMFKGDRPDPENIQHCTKLCLENPKWRLSLQTHKLLKIL